MGRCLSAPPSSAQPRRLRVTALGAPRSQLRRPDQLSELKKARGGQSPLTITSWSASRHRPCLRIERLPSHTVIGTEGGRGFWGGNTFVHSFRRATQMISSTRDRGPRVRGGGTCNGYPFVTFDNFGKSSMPTIPPVRNVLPSTTHRRATSTATTTSSQRLDRKVRRIRQSGQLHRFGELYQRQRTGTPSQTSHSSFSRTCGVTVDSQGNIWVVDQAKKELDEFSPTGASCSESPKKTRGFRSSTIRPGPGFWPTPGLTGVAVDPTNGDILVGQGERRRRRVHPSGQVCRHDRRHRDPIREVQISLRRTPAMNSAICM